MKKTANQYPEWHKMLPLSKTRLNIIEEQEQPF